MSTGDAAGINLAGGFTDSATGAAAQAAVRMKFWEALEENAGSMGAPVSGAKLKTSPTVPVFDALVAPLVDKKLGKEFNAEASQQQNPYTQLQDKIDVIPHVAPMRAIAEPDQKVFNKNVVADNEANKNTLTQTETALAAVADIEQDMNKLAAAEAAGQAAPPPEADKPQAQGGGIARSLALDTVATAGLSLIHPALGGAFAIASTGMTLARIASPGADMAAQVGRGFGGVQNEGEAKQYASKAEAKNDMPLSPAGGSAPAAHTFAAAAQGAGGPAPKAPAADDPLAPKLDTVSDSLTGMAKTPVQESPQLAAMRQSVEKIKFELTEIQDRALGRDDVYRNIAKNGFEVNANTVASAMGSGSKLNLDGNGPILTAGMRLG